MLPFLYLVILCWNFLFIRSEDNANLIVTLKAGNNCKTNSSYTFTEGQNVTLVVQPSMYINYGWWYLNTETGVKQLYDKLNTIEQKHNGTYPDILYSRIVDATMAGLWEFKFYYFRNNPDFKGMVNFPMVRHNDGANYTMSLCNTNVTIASKKPPPVPTCPTIKVIVIASAVVAVLLVVVIAETAYIFLLRAKARELITLNTHNNLSKKSDSIPDDRARYCTNPGQKIMKEPIPVEDDCRDSVIYEAPNIEISNNIRLPMQPPQPPAITTMPRTPRSNHSLKSNPKGMLASALNSHAPNPISDTLPPNFQRPKNFERERNVANRPPLPLPSEDYRHNPMIQEVYEEMGNENTYEPPPVINTMPPRLPKPPKKVPTGNLLDVKENTLKSRQGLKPPITPKPLTPRSHDGSTIQLQEALKWRNNDAMTPANEFEQALKRRNNESTLPRGNPVHMMQPQHQEQTRRRRPTDDGPTNELQEAMKRRNNVMQVPIVSIPDPSTRSSPKPIPPPVQKSKPPPIRHPVQEEIYYNEASSDEEWTYEPLKPLNNYDSNIYNI